MDWDYVHKRAFNNHAPNAVFYLFAGGISFTVGAILYAIKKPVFRSGIGFHEIFHLFVLLGGVFHYLLVYIALASLA
ncbi:MAG: hemolysin III family protein [Syntrophales bacterium]